MSNQLCGRDRSEYIVMPQNDSHSTIETSPPKTTLRIFWDLTVVLVLLTMTADMTVAPLRWLYERMTPKEYVRIRELAQEIRPGPPHLNRWDQLLQCPVIRQVPVWKRGVV